VGPRGNRSRRHGKWVAIVNISKNEKQRLYRNTNRDKVRESNRKYCINNKVKVAEYRKRYYELNKDRYALHKSRQYIRYCEWLNEIKTSKHCMFCGENDNACLDFHHLDHLKKK